VGRAESLAKISKHPLARAVRADKTCLGGIEATLLHYLKDEAEREIPIWSMIAMKPDQVKARAEAWRDALGQGEVLPAESTVGGGSLPGESFPSYVLSLTVAGADRFLKKLREASPPLIARTGDDKILLDPRSVLPEQDPRVAAILHSLFSESK